LDKQSAQEIVSVSRLNSGYNDVQILNDVSMSAMTGEITAILGASGCGKTTLLKHLIRLHRPWSGSISLFGKEITDMDEEEFDRLLLNIGVLFQNGALLNSINLAENIAIPLMQHTHLPRQVINRIIRVKLHLVELDDALTLLPSELSGGMRKRAALARAMALDPPLLLFDEPSAGLDPVTGSALDRLILKLRDELGVSMIVVTHEVPSILRIADRIVFMEDGNILFCGPIKEAMSSGIEAIDKFFQGA
jgi:phospholipid/cholesterol/gamma-HCH transport system ATP-binding protein